MTKFVMTSLITILVTNSILAQGENLFDDSFLHEIHFENMDTLLINGQKIYQMANMTFDGFTTDSIGIKDKGNLSSSAPNRKLPLKIKTNKYVSGKKYDGIKEFTLHNNFEDPTMMREKLTYDLCGQLGLFSLRTAFAKVYFNGDYWGIYTIVEGKDEFYKHQFDNRDADAIESLDFGDMCFISNVADDYNYDITGWPEYILENGDESTAFQRFSEMIDKANNTADDVYLSEVAGYLNLEHFFKYQAANVYLMNFDSYIGFKGNQIYLYDTIATIWQVIPWDFNASLNLWDDGNGNQYADAYPLYPNSISNGCIAERLNTIPELKNHYLNAMCELANSYADTITMNSQIDFLKNQIQTAVYADWRKLYSNQEFDETTGYGDFIIGANEFEGLKTFFADRYSNIKQSLIDEGFSCMTTSVDEDLNNELDATFFPNPSNDYLDVKQNHPIQQLSIYDIQGRKLRQINEPDFPLNIEGLKEGMYLVTAIIDKEVTTTRLLIQK